MQKFINFILKYKEYITFAALIVISFSLISLGDVSKIGGYRTFIIGSLGWIESIFSIVPNPGALKSENDALRTLNLQLSNEVTRMRYALLENKRLRDTFGLKEIQDKSYIASEVVGQSSIQLRRYLTLNKGKREGINRGMAVRNDAGLVGIIMDATDNYSLVELIANREIKVAGKDSRSDYTGIVTWDGSDNFLFKNIPKSYDVKAGDTITTSNYSNKYPPYIPIGYVKVVEDDPSDLFQHIVIKPFANFALLEEVFIIKEIQDVERNELIKQIDESLKARKEPPKFKYTKKSSDSLAKLKKNKKK
jgi:rod shape-determining protein MreC